MTRFASCALAAIAFATLAGCATPLAWEPRVDRLAEMPASPTRAATNAPAPAPVAAPAVAPASSPAPAERPAPVTFDEIVRMARDGTPSGVIIQKLRDSRLVYSVNATEAKDLASRGVPADVIAYLQRGEAGLPPSAAAPGTYREPVYAPPPAYYAAPYPYPYYAYPYYYGPWYPRAGISFGFRFGGRRR